MSEEEEIEIPESAQRIQIKWKVVLVKAAEIVNSYDTAVTLRQLFYRLVSMELIPNTVSAYKRLSSVTAIARRAGNFPTLIDNTRSIRQPGSWDDADDLMEWAKSVYRRDRTAGQEFTVYVAVEKNALAGLFSHWYQEKGIPVLAFGGYPSQTFVDDIVNDINTYSRPAVLIYGGDFDATGVDILRDFLKRTEGAWDQTHRVALNQEQIAKYKLPPLPGKSWDPRAASFIEAYGKLVQVELDALPPDVLKSIYDEKLKEFWDEKQYKKVMQAENEDRERLLAPEDVEEMYEALRELHDDTDTLLNRIGDHKMTIPKLRKNTSQVESALTIAGQVLEEHEVFDG